MPRHYAWLFDRYWAFAALVVVLSLPLVLTGGGRTDLLALTLFGVASIAAWAVARRSEGFAVRAHLVALVVFWAWYSDLPGGLPARADRGPAAHVVLLSFPLLIFVTLDGVRGAAALGLLAGATILYRFGATFDALTGLFLVGIAILIGFTFRRQAQHLQQVNERLVRIASHDPVTELPNRRALNARLEALESPKGALLFVDLSRFKTVTEAFGHGTGDELLRVVAERLAAFGRATRFPSFLAHLGGDQFALVLEGASPAEALESAERLCDGQHEPFLVEGNRLQLSCRVGVAIWPANTAREPSLFARADRAVAMARKQARRVALYDPSADAELDQAVEAELWQAIARGEIICHYQPVCELASNGMVGVEALVRWQHPTRGLVSPAGFVELAERTGQIVQIDRIVLSRVAAQLEAWLQSGNDLWVAANVSAHTLGDPSFIDSVREVLERHPTIRGRLVLEVTESAAMQDPERAIALLKEIRELGVRTALDDFGVGHSSLVYLKRLPADHLKLDRMFVSGIGVSDRDEALLELLLHLAKQFGMGVIAEGVETKEQLRWLTDRGCGFVQGFLFARPSAPSELELLRERVSGIFGVDPEPSSTGAARAGLQQSHR
ncbi:MAG: bifunctional diguanylate cyclase/phosphodiesterase [Polyangiaceae bacterium]